MVREDRAFGCWVTHPIIWNPVIVIIRVAFITQAVFVMILLARVGQIGAVVLEKNQRNTYGTSPHTPVVRR